MPGVPQNVNVISPNSTSLLVTWDHPLAPDRNGVITGYTVIRQSGSERDTAELFNNDTSHLLTGLVPFTEYNITVAGNTSAGQGEFTMPFIMRTLNDSEWRRDVIVHLCSVFAEETCKWFTVSVSWFCIVGNKAASLASSRDVSFTLLFSFLHSISLPAASEPLCPALSNPTINSVVVSWYPPGDPKGVITDYEVRR